MQKYAAYAVNYTGTAHQGETVVYLKRMEGEI